MLACRTFSGPDVRIVFMGSPAFAVPALHALAADPNIVISLVITQPDRRAGRGQQLAAPAVKTAAVALGLPLLQPASMRDDDAMFALAAAQPDLLVVVAYGELLRRAVLETPPHGALNVHPSLLPCYRGAAPIPAAILNGDLCSGISIIRLMHRMDAGPIVAQEEMDITPTDTTATLSERLARRAATLLPRICHDYGAGALTLREQNDAQATYTHEWTKRDARIDWNAPAVAIERLVRAAQPWPVAWSTVDGERLRVLRATIGGAHSSGATTPGDVQLIDDTLLVQTGTGALELLDVQPANKRAMSAVGWWRGRRAAALRLE